MNNIVPLKEKFALPGVLSKLHAALPPGTRDREEVVRRMVGVAMTACADSKYLAKMAQSNPFSVVGTVVLAAQLGLEVSRELGHAYIVPFKGTAQLIIGYKGKIKLAMNTGKVSKVSARIVCENDAFSYQFGLDENLVHQPVLGERGDWTHVYAVIWLKDGTRQFEVMTKEEVYAIRARSASYQMHKQKGIPTPWVTDELEMVKKSALHRLFKVVELSPECARADALDMQAEVGSQRPETVFDDVIDIKAAPDAEDAPGGALGDVTERLKGQREAAEAPSPEPAPVEEPDSRPRGGALRDQVYELAGDMSAAVFDALLEECGVIGTVDDATREQLAMFIDKAKAPVDES